MQVALQINDVVGLLLLRPVVLRQRCRQRGTYLAGDTLELADVPLQRCQHQRPGHKVVLSGGEGLKRHLDTGASNEPSNAAEATFELHVDLVLRRPRRTPGYQVGPVVVVFDMDAADAQILAVVSGAQFDDANIEGVAAGRSLFVFRGSCLDDEAGVLLCAAAREQSGAEQETLGRVSHREEGEVQQRRGEAVVIQRHAKLRLLHSRRRHVWAETRQLRCRHKDARDLHQCVPTTKAHLHLRRLMKVHAGELQHGTAGLRPQGWGRHIQAVDAGQILVGPATEDDQATVLGVEVHGGVCTCHWRFACDNRLEEPVALGIQHDHVGNEVVQLRRGDVLAAPAAVDEELCCGKRRHATDTKTPEWPREAAGEHGPHRWRGRRIQCIDVREGHRSVPAPHDEQLLLYCDRTVEAKEIVHVPPGEVDPAVAAEEEHLLLLHQCSAVVASGRRCRLRHSNRRPGHRDGVKDPGIIEASRRRRKAAEDQEPGAVEAAGTVAPAWRRRRAHARDSRSMKTSALGPSRLKPAKTYALEPRMVKVCPERAVGTWSARPFLGTHVGASQLIAALPLLRLILLTTKRQGRLRWTLFAWHAPQEESNRAVGRLDAGMPCQRKACKAQRGEGR
eukprot:scaffold2277_cov256-Pinguiococcus_pyrenoidosus.AAC.20